MDPELATVEPSPFDIERSIPKSLRLHGFELKFGVVEVRFQGELIHLSIKEGRLLGFMLQSSGNYIGRDQILGAVWPEMSLEAYTHTLATHIGRLRRRFRDYKITGVVLKAERNPTRYGIFFE